MRSAHVARFFAGGGGPPAEERHMPAICAVCGKGTTFGRNIRHQHSGRWVRKAPRTNRTFRPNLHKQVVFVDGAPIRVKICTRCLRTTTKA
jgi:large subunit ribosomal protein L28